MFNTEFSFTLMIVTESPIDYQSNFVYLARTEVSRMKIDYVEKMLPKILLL